MEPVTLQSCDCCSQSCSFFLSLLLLLASDNFPWNQPSMRVWASTCQSPLKAAERKGVLSPSSLFRNMLLLVADSHLSCSERERERESERASESGEAEACLPVCPMLDPCINLVPRFVISQCKAQRNRVPHLVRCNGKSERERLVRGRAGGEGEKRPLLPGSCVKSTGLHEQYF